MTFPADGGQVDFVVAFIGEEACFYHFNTATNLAPCSDLVCDVPANINAAVTGNQVDLSWDYVADWMSYEYRYRPTGTTEWIHQWTNKTRATICDLGVNQTYEYEIRAYCGNNRKSDFGTAFFTTESGTTICEVTESGSTCAIANLEVLNIRNCHDRGTINPTDDYFYADVVVYFQQSPTFGELNLTGNTTASVAVSELQTTRIYRFNRLKLLENGNQINLTAAFSANDACQYTLNYPIPENPCWQGRSKQNDFPTTVSPMTRTPAIELSVYPNPARDILNVKLPNPATGALVIYNILGERVSQQLISNLQNINVNLTAFEKGSYHLVVQSDAGLWSHKFIKQ